MKKNLSFKFLFLLAVWMTSLTSYAQEKKASPIDLKKIALLKEYVRTHPLAEGQTSSMAELLKKFEREIDQHSIAAVANDHPRSSQRVDAPPANDDCANATVLTEGSSCTPVTCDVAEATESMPADLCNTFTSATAFDVWYSFVAVTSTPNIYVAGSAGFDAVVFLFDGCGGSVLACSDGTGAGGTEFIAASGLNPGDTYYIRVYSWGAALPPTTTFDICVYSTAPPPANDECANAIVLTEDAVCNPTLGDAAGATESMPADVCNTFTSPNGFDVWYSFVAVTSTPYISVTGSAGFDAVVFLFDGCGGSVLACSDVGLAGQTELIAASGLNPGDTYYIRVYPYGNMVPVTSTFNICVYSAPAPPVNDDCSGAILITQNATCNPTLGDVAGASESMPADICNTFTSGSAFDVWYQFVPTTTSPFISVTGISTFDPVIFLYDGCGGSMLGCSDGTGPGGTEIIPASGLTIGSTYYVRVYSFGDAMPPASTFNICVFTDSPYPSNDTICGAIALTLDGPVETGDISLASPTDPEDAIVADAGYMCSTPNNTVWYSYFATTADSFYVVYTTSGGFDGWLGIFTSDDAGSPCEGTLTYMDCPADANSSTQVYGIAPPGAGTEYVFMVDGVNGEAGPFSLQVISASPTGIKNIVSKAGAVSVYPNPSTGMLMIDPGISTKASVKIFDVPGNLLREKIIEKAELTKLDISDLSNGIYFVKIETENGSVVKRVSLNK